MPSYRLNGPTCGSDYIFDTGTLSRALSPMTGPMCSIRLACMLEQICTTESGDRKPLITAEQLKAIMPRLKVARAAMFVPHLQKFFVQYQIDTVTRIAAFLGQVALESQQFNVLEENLRYTTTARLRAVFPSKFADEDAAKPYTGDPEKLANFIYAGKLANGDVKSGDGWKYRGRGLIQLTGRVNYDAFKKASSINVIDNPELLLQPEHAVHSATWFWYDRGLNALADAGRFKELTKRINAPALHFEERERYRKKALEVFSPKQKKARQQSAKP